MSAPKPSIGLIQTPALFDCPISSAVLRLAEAGIEERGAIFTKREVVDFILSLVGYSPKPQLLKKRLLEPSFGHGDFLLPIIERLLSAWKKLGRPDPVASLSNCIRGVELHWLSFEATRLKVIKQLQSAKIDNDTAIKIADKWLIYGDFLLTDLDGSFDFVVGNPPYVRQELIDDTLMKEYRSRYHTIYDRADIYIPFIERSLSTLKAGGVLGFICADRWMKNRYGQPLRKYVASKFHLKFYIDMTGTDAFHEEVDAYPAVTVISRERSGSTRIAHRPKISHTVLGELAQSFLEKKCPTDIKELKAVAVGSEPWILESSDQIKLIRRLEKSFPKIEEAGCKVGIGVATGADKAFIAPFDELDVEECRKLPLAMTKDLKAGGIEWRGFGILNPFDEHGKLVKLEDFPKFQKYLEERREVIAKRHIAKKNPDRWYKTIDRIYPELTKQEKLLIPDIRGEAQISYEEGRLYPHHNLYFITSECWNLYALQAVLLSGIAKLFVASYSTQMRGGYMRFQAQYLRRIRLPMWSDVSDEIRIALTEAGLNKDLAAANDAVFKLYSLTKSEQAALGGNEY